MLFNSIDFFVFFAVVFAVYWISPHRARWTLLLVASYFFYMSWEPSYILLIVLSTSIDYILCRTLTGSEEKKKRKWGLTLSVSMNLGLLFVFKYYDFFQQSLADILGLFHVDYAPNAAGFLLPVGISFYTFQTLSYSIDVYRKQIQPERHFGKFALYVSFFPQLVAGPIERAKDLLPQFGKKLQFVQSAAFKSGALLIIWGLFKKVVVADNCAGLVDTYYGSFEQQTGGTMLFATYLFAVQIYCDFSGYSDMAIGLARLLGFDLKYNFKTPYFSHSITAFWRRWHISLSRWMRDYIYIPLGGNKGGTIKTSGNLLSTMMIGGLWHGASWNFIIWGAINGIVLSIEKWFNWTVNYRWVSWIKAIIVFHIVCVTWVFFRSESFDQAIHILRGIVTLTPYDLYFIIADNKDNAAVIASTLLLLFEIQHPFQSIERLMSRNIVWRYSHYVLLIFLLLFLGNSAGAPFIYFQF